MTALAYYYEWTCPQVANESSGHIYMYHCGRTMYRSGQTEHYKWITVYLTLWEYRLTYLPWVLLAATMVFGAILEGTLPAAEKSDDQH
ncbi:MAG: hypothetical protein ABSE51_14680 [Terracidiphilus sp.]|jgi:hypothetical protein